MKILILSFMLFSTPLFSQVFSEGSCRTFTVEIDLFIGTISTEVEVCVRWYPGGVDVGVN